MKIVQTLFLLFVGVAAMAEELPRDCYGSYAGEMAAYSVLKNDVELNIEKHDVFVSLKADGIFYSSGTIELKGSYTFLKQSGSQYLIKASLTNGKNVSYQIDLLWNKKSRSLFLEGKNGEPDLTLVKLDR
ncbi:MAG: hypothetical protein HYZ14_18815 [Bacteroidetes bacterium]|nr:hypothetical protein [Bacteroidota bacterium]